MIEFFRVPVQVRSPDSYNQLFRVANEELTNVDQWLTANKLSLNISKTNEATLCFVLSIANCLAIFQV